MYLYAIIRFYHECEGGIEKRATGSLSGIPFDYFS